MRQSSTLLALLTVSATLGLASQARGEVPIADAQRQRQGAAQVIDLMQPLTLTADSAEAAEIPRGGLPVSPATASTVPSPAADRLPAVLAQSEDEAPTLEGGNGMEPGELDASEETEETEADEGVEAVDPLEDADETDETPPAETSSPSPLGQPGQSADSEPQVLVAEVVVEGAEDALTEELETTVYEAVTTQPGRTTTRSQLQQDINNIFATGLFANVRAVPEDTPLGVRVTFVVQPNPVLQEVRVVGNQVLPPEVVDEIFAEQYGEIINLVEFQDGILALNDWYQEQGYVLAQVIAAPEVSSDGVVTLEVAEGVIEDIEVRFLTEDGLTEDEEGNPIEGRTREFIITRELETKPGDVFQQSKVQSDLQRVFGLGLFDDVNLTLNPGEEDPRKVTMVVNVVERNTGSVAAGIGFNFAGDLFGTLSYRQENLGGNNQTFAAETQLSTNDLLFDISFTDPWIAGDPNRTSYTINGFARRAISLVFEGGDNEIDLANGDRPRITRFGTGVSFRRPLDNGWSASVGTEYNRVRATDADGNIFTEDAAGNPLTASDSGEDDLWTFQFGVVQDLRNDRFNPTNGSVLRLGTEQSVPLGSGSIFFNRLRASYSYYIPVDFISLFGEGPQAIALNIQGGTIIGDFPPYEAFTLGGTNSVRGYDEGELGAGGSFLQATAEYRFPLFSFVGAALFLDAGTHLGTQDAVDGNPGGDRDKPGSGFGYGAGLRIQTPLGPIRVDYGINDEGDGQLHFGIGERF